MKRLFLPCVFSPFAVYPGPLARAYLGRVTDDAPAATKMSLRFVGEYRAVLPEGHGSDTTARPGRQRMLAKLGEFFERFFALG